MLSPEISPEETPASDAYLMNLSPEIRAQISLIRELNSKRSQRVKSIIGLENRIASLESGVEIAHAALEQLKCIKEIAEKEDPSSKKVESRLKDSAMMFPEAWIALYTESRIAHLLDGIAYEEDSLKNKEQLVRVEFVRIIDKLDKKARELERVVAYRLGNDDSAGITIKEERHQTDESIHKQLIDLKKTNFGLEQDNRCLKETTFNLKKQLSDQKNHMKAEKSDWKEKQKRLLREIEEVTKQKDILIERSNKTETYLVKEELLLYAELLDEHKALLQGQKDMEKNLPLDGNPNSTLQKLIDTMKLIIAPKGTITGDELGSLMGSFVSITAYIVTLANSDMKITAVSGFITLCGQLIGTLFNNLVKDISTVENVGVKSNIVVKALTSLPWILLGGLVPIFVGGFIPSWKIRVKVTSGVTFLVQVLLAIFFSRKYNIPTARAVCFIVLGVLGIGLTAGAAQLLKKFGKI